MRGSAAHRFPGTPSRAAMYHLRRHVYACQTSRYYVFMDLPGDNYFSVPREDLAELVPWIHGGDLGSRKEQPKTRPSAAATAFAAELVAAGVLMEGPPEQDVQMPTAAAPTSDLASTRASLHAPKTSLRLFASVATSLIYARQALRFTPISLIVDAVAACKRAASVVEVAECKNAMQLTEVFLHFRPLFPWDYRCLFDSLALIRFLSRFALYPDWIFGVQDDPFNAHCWVQAGSLVLNDDLERVRSYTPIMKI